MTHDAERTIQGPGITPPAEDLTTGGETKLPLPPMVVVNALRETYEEYWEAEDAPEWMDPDFLLWAADRIEQQTQALFVALGTLAWCQGRLEVSDGSAPKHLLDTMAAIREAAGGE